MTCENFQVTGHIRWFATPQVIIKVDKIRSTSPEYLPDKEEAGRGL
jgi:hypothetical protein